MGIRDVLIVSVPVADQARARAFYTDKLGFELAMQADNIMGPGRHWIVVRPKGSAGAGLTLVNWFDSMPAGSLRGLVVETEEVDADHARLKAAGVKIEDLQDAPWGRYAVFEDSEGNSLVLQQSRPI